MEKCNICKSVDSTRRVLFVVREGEKVLYVNDEGELEYADKTDLARVKINYCPMCGRELDGCAE